MVASLVGFLLSSMWQVSRADDDAGTNLSALVDVYWALNPNDPVDGANFLPGAGTTAKRNRELMVNQALISLERTGKVGGHLTIGFGSGFEVLQSDQPVAPGIGPQVFRHVLRASVTVRLPAGPGLDLEAGILPGHLGLESFVSRENWNYTRGWMAEWVPYVQSGVKVGSSIVESLRWDLLLLNGWGTIGPGGGAVGTALRWGSEVLSLRLNTFAGPQREHVGRPWRLYLNGIVQAAARGRIFLAAAVDGGWQEASPGWDAWQAVGLHARWHPLARLAFAARGEWFRDPAGVVAFGAQTLRAITATLETRPRDELVLKLELRHDHSTEAVFAQGRGFTSTQWLGVVGAVASF